MVFSLLSAHRDHSRCMHDVMFKDLKLEEVKVPIKHTLSTVKQPLRVNFDLDQLENGRDSNQCTKVGERKFNGYNTETCAEDDIMTPEKLSIIKATFANVQQHLSELLKVDRSTSMSSLHDVRIIVNARPYGDTDVLAAAAATRYEYTQHRSIEGQMYLNPKEIPKHPLSKDSEVRFFYDVLVHETFHVLGIANNLFHRWKDPATRDNYKNMFVDYEDPKYPDKKFRFFQTPNAIKVAQRRFGRKTLPNGKPLGIELELLGGGGTEGSHIKGRAYYNEIMSGISLPPERISDITLALLEDTGWYEANYFMAEPLAWGDGKSFSDKEMSDFPLTPPDEFPDNYICPPYKNKEYLCNYDYTGVSECGVPLYVPNCDKPQEQDEKEICSAREWYDSDNSHWFGPSDVFDYMKILKARE